MLIYQSGLPPIPARKLVWMDRTGKPTGSLDTASPSQIWLRLSPDGKRAAYSAVTGGSENVWVYDVDRDQEAKLTSGGGHLPAWSPDGTQLVFDSSRFDPGLGVARTTHVLYITQSNGASSERRLLAPETGYTLWAFDWSPIEPLLVFAKSAQAATRDFWILPLVGDGKPFPYLTTPSDEGAASISPNGRWLAYATDESGIYQVIVQPFPDPSVGKWSISSAGGTGPRWKRDGTELYYMDREGQIVAVRVKTHPTFHAGKPVPLFKTSGPGIPGTRGLAYDVTPDGQRFLVLFATVPVDTSRYPVQEAPIPAPITVLVNWTSALKE
jgi:Tol biopolymer transport system component